jgi:hypothetical protein
MPAELEELIQYTATANAAPHGASSIQFVIAVNASLNWTKSITL